MKLKKMLTLMLLVSIWGMTGIHAVFAQTNSASHGSIEGIILDSISGQPLVGATINLVEGFRGTSTDENGQFRIALVTPGKYTVTARYMGYENVEVSNVEITSTSPTHLELKLFKKGESIAEVAISVPTARGGELNLIADRQHAQMANVQIGAQEVSRKGLSDASQAVAQLAGVSKPENSREIYVRGLGDRYMSTSLNGLPLPSNDPEKKNINLALFASDVVEKIALDKVYNETLSGDFGGGHVDIHSKQHSGPARFEISISSTQNLRAWDQANNFQTPQWAGMYGFNNAKIPNNALGAFNFSSAENTKQTYQPGSIKILGGNQWNFNNGGKLQAFGTASFGNGYQYKEGFTRSVNAQGARLLDLDNQQFSYNTATTGLVNLSYSLPNAQRISYNFLFTNGSETKNDQYQGYVRDLAEENNGHIQGGTYTQNRLFVNQMLGDHGINDRLSLNWGLSASAIDARMPNRIQHKARFVNSLNAYVVAQNTDTDNHRYFQNLDETEYAVNLQATYKLNTDETLPSSLSVGYQGRLKNRDFEAIQYNFRVSNPSDRIIDPQAVDAFFNADNYAAGYFTIGSYAGNTPQTYEGEQTIHAVYAQQTQHWTPKLSSVIGLRFEQIDQYVGWRTQMSPDADGSSIDKFAFLPSLHLKYTQNEFHQFRLGASKTYTLPQFKERAVFVYEDIADKKIGNPDLYPSDNYNLDLGWEWFPGRGEFLAVTAFGKYIVNPINETTIASSTNDISFVNTGDVGKAFGVELEGRKPLFDRDNGHKMTLGFNVTYMHSTQELDNEKVFEETDFSLNLTDKSAAFTGASDVLANVDLSYERSWANGAQTVATLNYAHRSDYIYSLGTETKGNFVEKGVGTLDFILKSKITSRLGIDFAFRNLLDPEYKRVQENASGSVPVLSFKNGRAINLGINYRF